MERNQRRHGHPGREHRRESSRRPYSDEQETYRNPRNEYDDDRGSEYRQHGRQDERNRDREFGQDDSNRYGASERGYGYRDQGFSDDSEYYEPGYAARRQGQSRDTWEEPETGNFSDTRSRWPRDDRYRSEPRSQNWPHSRTGGRVSEYGYFGDESEGHGGRHQGGSRYGLGSRPQRGYQSGYGAQQQGSSQFGYLGGSEEPGESRYSSRYDYRQQGGQQSGSQSGYGQPEGGPGHGNRRFDEDYSGRGPRNYSRSDERIKEDICDELSSDRQCNAEDIEIEVKDGMVTLSGTVPSRKMKHRAEDIADAARGVKDVDNRIRVTGRVGTRGSSTGDDESRSSGNEDAGSSNGRPRKSEWQQSSRSSSRK
ncbi:MAG TPA: BON domain-containing protein [Woeseiaceae bacterium]|nr:BON domain-containing protein [Woeseiaceae bacterium]